MPISNEPMTWLGFQAIKAQVTKELMLTPKEWLELCVSAGVLDSAGGQQNLLNTSGQVTEASAATISTNVIRTAIATIRGSCPVFTRIDYDANAADQQASYHRIACVTMVTDGSGNCAATTIVPALASYTGHALIIGLTSTVADAAGTYTWAVAAGTILGPSVFTMQVAANQFTFFSAAVPNVSGVGLPIRGTVAADDNKAITLAIANGAATSTHWVYVEYWYET